MWKWIVIGLLLIIYIPGYTLAVLPGNILLSLSLERMAPKREAAEAKTYLEAVRTHNFSVIERDIDPAYKTAKLRAQLEAVADEFPSGNPKSVRLVNFRWMQLKDEKTISLTYTYDYAGPATEAEVVLQESGGKFVLKGLHVQELDPSAAEANAFTFAGKGWGHYVVAAATIALFAFTLITFYWCMRTPIPRYKWAWGIFVLLGFVGFYFNWTTGAYEIRPVAFLLCSIGFQQAQLGPMVFQLAIPVGAILFWFRRGRWIETATPAAL